MTDAPPFPWIDPADTGYDVEPFTLDDTAPQGRKHDCDGQAEDEDE